MNKEFFDNMNWGLLAEQKKNLLALCTNENKLEGIIHILDDIQDYACDVLGIPENVVFTEINYLNFYICKDCNEHWNDVADSMCNDRCPVCNKEIEPYNSELYE